jgi:hypothetical protein
MCGLEIHFENSHLWSFELVSWVDVPIKLRFPICIQVLGQCATEPKIHLSHIYKRVNVIAFGEFAAAVTSFGLQVYLAKFTSCVDMVPFFRGKGKMLGVSLLPLMVVALGALWAK